MDEAQDFESDLIRLEHDLDRLLSSEIPTHFADRLADDANRLQRAAERARHA